MIFDIEDYDDHQAVVLVRDDASGMRAMIAIHDTTLGPAHGGTRLWHYRSDEEALTDVLRLSRGMTYKNAVAGLPFGGGKSVILANGADFNRTRVLEAFGAAVEALGGRYILAEDVGITPADVEVIASRTSYACGIPLNGDNVAADPGPYTARGVYLAMKAALQHQSGSGDLAGRTVVVQGLGGVGLPLCRMLAADGVSLKVADIDARRVARTVAETGATSVAGEDIFAVPADVFAPCALGGIVDNDVAQRIAVDIVCGGANNQLATPQAGQILHDRGILYAPDFVVNAGGVTHTTSQITNYSADEVNRRIAEIPDRLRRVFDLAKAADTPTQDAAERLARDIIARHSAAPAMLEVAHSA